MQATYYGFIEEIWELDYGRLKAALFCCLWVRLEEISTDKEGFTTVDLTKTAYIQRRPLRPCKRRYANLLYRDEPAYVQRDHDEALIVGPDEDI
jgi:hypothetical protein